ncbi:ISNCY family transposase, partial [Burkholderia contaminans]|nr:ISNCY family transposase [Burkholderia contaminans]
LLSAQSYDRLAEVDQGAIVDHKRLSHALQVAQAFQAQRDSRRIGTAPSRTHRGLPVRANEAQPGTKKPRRFTVTDMEAAILEVASKAETERRSAKARG